MDLVTRKRETPASAKSPVPAIGSSNRASSRNAQEDALLLQISFNRPDTMHLDEQKPEGIGRRTFTVPSILQDISMPRPHRLHLLAIGQALFVTLLWSSSWVLIKFGLEQIPAISFAGLRYSLAFLVLAPVVLLRRDLRRSLAALSARDWRHLSLLGVVFYALTQGAQFVGLSLLPAVTLSLILSFSPAAVALLGVTFLGEHLGRRQWAGVVVFLAGALLYLLPVTAPVSLVGLAVAVLGLAANSCGAILGRSVNRSGQLHSLLVTVVSMGVGSFLLLATGLALEGLPKLDPRGWSLVLWLAIVNTALAFTLWNHTLRMLTAIESSLINNTMIIQIAILAWLFLDEPIGTREACGLLLAFAGVLLVQLPVRDPGTD